ncbi:MAG: carboxymuconolactone decarboxylase family protein [Chloroflexota bacterium]
MKLDDHTRALIAVGASVAANCQPCLKSTVAMALESGADNEELEEAVEVGKRVRRGAASKMDDFAASLTQPDPLAAAPANGGCGCATTTE